MSALSFDFLGENPYRQLRQATPAMASLAPGAA
jgi:hypothetical protein